MAPAGLRRHLGEPPQGVESLRAGRGELGPDGVQIEVAVRLEKPLVDLIDVTALQPERGTDPKP